MMVVGGKFLDVAKISAAEPYETPLYTRTNVMMVDGTWVLVNVPFDDFIIALQQAMGIRPKVTADG